MRNYLIVLSAACIMTACGNTGGTSQDPNNTKSGSAGGSQNGNNTGAQNGNNTSAQNGNNTSAQNGNSQNGNTAMPGANSVTGTVQGHALAAKSAIYATGQIASQNGNTNLLTLVISDQADPCTAITNNAHSKNSTSLTMVLLKGDSSGNTVAPTSGAYSMSSGDATSLMAGQGELFVDDATCTAVLTDAQATVNTGTLNITSTTVDGVAPLVGTFKFVVGSQNDNLSGTFNAVACPALLARAAGTTTGGTCQ